MSTPYELLERIAAKVASHVPGSDTIFHVEVEFSPSSLDLRIQSTPFDEDELYDLSLRAPVEVPETLAAWLRGAAVEYFEVLQARSELDLSFLRLSVKVDGEFFVGQSHRQRNQT